MPHLATVMSGTQFDRLKTTILAGLAEDAGMAAANAHKPNSSSYHGAGAKASVQEEVLSARGGQASVAETARAPTDKSPKGCIDSPIIDLIHLVNSLSDYVTTSSCSGRVVLYSNSQRRWLYVTHEEASESVALNTLHNFFVSED